MEANPQWTSSNHQGHLSAAASEFYLQVYRPASAGCLNDLRKRGCAEEEAEEIFAATFEHVMQTVDPIARSFATPQMVNLLKTACRRRLIDERRHDRVLHRVPLDEAGSVSDDAVETPDELAERHEEVEIGREAVASLSDRDRRVFIDRHGYGLEPEEIVERMPGLTRRSYRKILQRANARVLRAFEEIDSGARCREMERDHLQRYVSSEASEDEVVAVEAHLRHCRTCQHSVLRMRGYLHDVASGLAAIFGGTASVGVRTHSNWIAEGAARLVDAGEGLLAGTKALRERLRDQAFRAATSVPGSGGDAAAGQLIGASTAKVAAGCVAGAAATTAACVALGVSPLAVVGVSHEAASPRPVERKAERHRARRVIAPVPPSTDESPEPAAEPATTPPPASPEPEKNPSQSSHGKRNAKPEPVDEAPAVGGPTAGLEGAGRTPTGTAGTAGGGEAEQPPEISEGTAAASSGSVTPSPSDSGGSSSGSSSGGGAEPIDGGAGIGL